MSRSRRRNITHIHNTYPQASPVKTSALLVAYVCVVIWMGLYFSQKGDMHTLQDIVRTQSETVQHSQEQVDHYRTVAHEALRRLASMESEPSPTREQYNLCWSLPTPDLMTEQAPSYTSNSSWSPNCTALRTKDEVLVRSYQDTDGMDCEVYRNNLGAEHTFCTNNDQILMVGGSDCTPVVAADGMSYWVCSDESQNEHIAQPQTYPNLRMWYDCAEISNTAEAMGQCLTQANLVTFPAGTGVCSEEIGYCCEIDAAGIVACRPYSSN